MVEGHVNNLSKAMPHVHHHSEEATTQDSFESTGIPIELVTRAPETIFKALSERSRSC